MGVHHRNSQLNVTLLAQTQDEKCSLSMSSDAPQGVLYSHDATRQVHRMHTACTATSLPLTNHHPGHHS